MLLDHTRWPEADALIERALEVPLPEREAFVRRAAAGDEALADAVLAVLAESTTDDEFLPPAGALGGALFADWSSALGADSPPAPSAGDAPAVLEAGARLGPYEVRGLLGRGGMGEVYRAFDERLGREVALKVLPAAMAHDSALRERLEREARVLGAFSHPNIAAIYDIVDADRRVALVLELADGGSLADRLARGALPVAECLRVARGIVDALEAAHYRGVVHRDLKPANVGFSRDNVVKVLDFGLAKALTGLHGGAGGPGLDVSIEGVIRGTAPYMSPEQARGLRVDHRTDVWGFGCILYEMLTGHRAFGGKTTTDAIARVLERAPDFTALPTGVPLALRRLIRRSLEKAPERRLGFIGDARLDLADADAELQGAAPDEGAEARSAGHRRWRRWAAMGAAAALAAVAVAGWLWPVVSAPPGPSRLAVVLPDADAFITGQAPALAISPDGRRLVYRASRDGVIRLHLRDLDREEPHPLDGTEGAAAPFFSPDGRAIGFDRDGTLFTLSLDGGPPLRIAEAPGGASASWSPRGEIVFATGARRVLYRVSANGGQPVPLTTLDVAAGDEAHALPHVLPDGRAVLFSVLAGNEWHLAVVPVTGGAHRRLGAGLQPRVLARTAGGGWLGAGGAEQGRLLFVREGSLFSSAFDLTAARLMGPQSSVLDEVQLASITGVAHAAVSESGTLAFLPRRTARRGRTFAWLTSGGGERPLGLEPRRYSRFSLSPDERRIAVSISEDAHDIWVHDLERGTTTRVTFDAALDTAPIWTRDGRSLVFRSDREAGGLHRVAADGASPPVQITRPNGTIHTAYDVTADGAFVLFTDFRSYREQDVKMAPMDGSLEERVLVGGPGAQLRPQLSPDGRWLAYQSDESGRFEIYVRPWPDVESARVQVSTGGGTSPVWSRDGRRLLYYDGRGIVGVPVPQGEAPGDVRRWPASAPERVVEAPWMTDRLGPIYSVARDGRLLVLRGGDDDAQARWRHLVVIERWADGAVGDTGTRGSSWMPRWPFHRGGG